MRELDYYSEKFQNAKKLTGLISDYLNNFSYLENSAYFNDAMSREHRTLQQNFARLIFGCIEFKASDEYRTDARNQDSKKIAEDIIREFSKFIREKYHIEETESQKPSQWLGTV